MRNIFCLLLVVFFAAFASCKDDETSLKGGTGGQLTLVAKTYHHNKAIKGSVVYIKYAVKEFPGTDTTQYDARYQASSGADSVIITGLQSGSYYLYGMGVDSALSGFQNGYNVFGGIPYSTAQTTGVITITVPVTEGD